VNQAREALAEKVLAGDRRALARAITLIESTRPDHRAEAERLIEHLLPKSGKSLRLGISGPPGVGKSTFIEAFGQLAIAKGRKVAVLAIDPSSRISGGSILGDKTRMAELSKRSEAFIRPSPAGEALGGIARRTREAMLACEAAGFDLVIVETIGVGQSETAVADMVDLFLLLLPPAGGDELQGIKRGIMELADLVLVNKADGDLAPAATRAEAEIAHALRLLQPRHRALRPAVMKISALTGQGLDDVWARIEEAAEALTKSGAIKAQRRLQAKAWLWRELSDSLIDALKAHADIAGRLEKLEAKVVAGKISPGAAARELLARFRGED
jgi:LAO/AO transport system kinase